MPTADRQDKMCLLCHWILPEGNKFTESENVPIKKATANEKSDTIMKMIVCLGLRRGDSRILLRDGTDTGGTDFDFETPDTD